MVNSNQSPRLIKHIIRSYARLSENSRVRPILKDNLPTIFSDKKFQSSLDEASKRWIQNIFRSMNLSNNSNSVSKGLESSENKEREKEKEISLSKEN